MDFGLQSRVALVTGASKGIGCAVAMALAKEGVAVTIASRSAENLRVAAAKIERDTGYSVDKMVFDTSDNVAYQAAIEAVYNTYGRFDILINNAAGPSPGTFDQHEDKVWQEAFQSQLMPLVVATRNAVPLMQKNSWGRILSVTTTLAEEPVANMVLSSSFRAANSAFIKAVSQQFTQDRITLNALCPSAVLTDRTLQFAEIRAKEQVSSIEVALSEMANDLPMKRYATAAEVGSVAAFLCSEQAAYITGRSIAVDGGVLRSYF